MSGSIGSRGATAQPKQISSRLLNMKFMQRAAAADKTQPAPSPKTPGSQPSFKRRRTDDFNSGNESPSTTGTPVGGYNNNAFADPASAPRGQNHFQGNTFETQWVLNVNRPGLQGTSTRTGSIYARDDRNGDEDEDEEEDDIWSTSAPSGRQTYGSFKKKKNTTIATTTSTMDTGVDDFAATPGSQSQSKSAKRNVKRKDREPKGAMDLLIDDGESSSLQSGNSDSDSDDDDDDDDDSNEDSESDEVSLSSPVQNTATRQKQKNKKQRQPPPPPAAASRPIDFLSDEYNQKLDRMDFRKSGFGKQRPGLSGNNGGRRSQGNTPKGRGKLGGQAIFEHKKKQRQSM